MAPLPRVAPSERLHHVDALRAMAVLLLIVFHTGLVFTPFYNFVVVNPQRSLLVGTFPVAFLHLWHMPLLFFLAGCSLWFALGRRSGGQIVGERVQRILIPFVFGFVVLIPPQVYYGLVSRSQFFGSYTAFFPLYFTEGVRDGIITYHHLWFILYLFVFSLVTLPLLLVLRSRRARPLMDRLARFLAHPGAIFLLPLPLVLTEIAFRARYPGYYDFVDDWANVALFAGMLVAGFVVVSDTRIMDAIRRQWRLALAVAVALTATILLVVWVTGDRPAPGYLSPAYIPFCAVTVLNTWCWIVGLFGAGQAIFTRRTRLLAYASEVSYPLYILHQTVLVALAFYITPLSMGIAAKFALIALPTLLISAGLVELAKLSGVTRFLLGMRPRRAA